MRASCPEVANKIKRVIKYGLVQQKVPGADEEAEKKEEAPGKGKAAQVTGDDDVKMEGEPEKRKKSKKRDQTAGAEDGKESKAPKKDKKKKKDKREKEEQERQRKKLEAERAEAARKKREDQ